ncbi:MAG: 4-hydroxy-2-oxovalerate aldolase, partial [Mesorhizobium sp.]
MYDFRKKCISLDRLIGTFCAIPHPVAVEVAAASGVDFLCIDWEHSQIGRERLEDLIRAADVHKVPAMVRVPGHTPEWIAAALDAG